MDPNVHYEVYACLPFVQLPAGPPLVFGSLTFWRASDYRKHVEHPQAFADYLEHITHVRVTAEESGQEVAVGLETAALHTDAMTCISMDSRVSAQDREPLMVNSLYALYFGLILRELYHDVLPIAFDPFSVLVPASEPLVRDREAWSDRWIPEASRRRTLSIAISDPVLLTCLGHSLQAIYLPNSLPPGVTPGSERHLVRAVRFFVDRFFGRFHTPFKGAFEFPQKPENILFLTSSFEAFFGHDQAGTAAELKRSLRAIRGMGFSRSVELMWGWVDGLYRFKNQMAHASPEVQPIYRGNPCFDVPYIYLATKLFILVICTELFTRFQKRNGHAAIPLEELETWLDSREITHVFWPVDALLVQIAQGIGNLEKVEDPQEYMAELVTLMKIYVSVYRTYIEPGEHARYHPVKYIAPDPQVMRSAAQSILAQARTPGSQVVLLTDFVACLRAHFSL